MKTTAESKPETGEIELCTAWRQEYNDVLSCDERWLRGHRVGAIVRDIESRANYIRETSHGFEAVVFGVGYFQFYSRRAPQCLRDSVVWRYTAEHCAGRCNLLADVDSHPEDGWMHVRGEKLADH